MPEASEAALALEMLAADVPRAWLDALLDAVPTPTVLLEPGTGVVWYANAAASALLGERLRPGTPVHQRDALLPARDPAGRRLEPDERPGARAARGERLRDYHVDVDTEAGRRSLLVQSDVLPAMHDQPSVVVLTFEDVTALRVAEGDARRSERLKDDTVALLDTLFFTAPVGLAFFDRDLRYARVNRTLSEVNGVPVDEHVGRTVGEVVPELADAVEPALRSVLDTGEAIVDRETVGRTPADGEAHTWSISYYPVANRSGRVIGIGAVVVDLTDRMRLLESERRARARAAFLARAGEVLGASLDDEETLRQLARLAVPAKADWCAIDVIDQAGRLRRVAVRHLDPAKERLGWEAFERWPPRLDESDGLAAAVRTGEPQLFEDIPAALLERGARDDEHLALLREVGMRSAMIVPLYTRGRIAGAMTFVLAESGGHYGPDDLSLAVEVARRASIAMENASLHQQLRYIASTLQASLLPSRLPDIPGFEMATRYRAAGEGFEVGGDFYDAFSRAEGSWAIILGDVVGKGPPAAALTAMARYTARAAAYEHAGPSAVLGLLNEAVRREADDERFMSAVCCMLSEGSPPRVRLASGGHPPPVLLRGAAAELVPVPGWLLGVGPDAGLGEVELELDPGDVLVLYTDGVTDAAMPARPLVLSDVAAVVERSAGRSADDIAAALQAAALEGTDGRARDDMAIVVLRRLPL